MICFISYIVKSAILLVIPSTPYVCDKNLNFVMQQLEQQSNIALKRFEDNNMKMNASKCHLLSQETNTNTCGLK